MVTAGPALLLTASASGFECALDMGPVNFTQFLALPEVRRVLECSSKEVHATR